jgi:NAD(P)-dependent dehydrogenase (short-subunit alcohol dehydrogenase family)
MRSVFHASDGDERRFHGMKRLAGRVALVTGSTQGLGEGVALRLGLAGAAVMVNGRSAEKGATVVAKFRELGLDADFVQANLSRREEAVHAVERTATRFGRLDILINNAQTVPLHGWVSG